MTKIRRCFTVVVPTVEKLGDTTSYTWDYKDFVVKSCVVTYHAYELHKEDELTDSLSVISVCDPSGNVLVSFNTSDMFGQSYLSDEQCMCLLSGVKELVETTINRIYRLLLDKANNTLDAIKLFNAK